ncbi:MAG: hypothetical protein R2822_30420 [Spirosomataceae bacterium]
MERAKDGQFLKADIFRQPVAFSSKQRIETAEDALLASLNWFGKVNVEYMQEISGQSQEKLLNQLQERLLYNPIREEYQTREMLLSGNVLRNYKPLKTTAKPIPTTPKRSEPKRHYKKTSLKKSLLNCWNSTLANAGFRHRCIRII